MKIYLLGDSVFDNAPYVKPGGSLIEIMKNQFDLEAELLAVDGNKIEHLPEQMRQIDKTNLEHSHFFFSAGGNDILPVKNEFSHQVGSLGDGLSHIYDFQKDFAKKCEEYLQCVNFLLEKGAKVGVFTIYEGSFNEVTVKRAVSAGVSIFNDVLYRTFYKLNNSHKNFRMYELRELCHEKEDFANPIEPSAKGAEKIARFIKAEVQSENGTKVNFSNEIKEFIQSTPWTFARTYAKTWPHHYIVRDRVDEALFVKLVEHIRKYGYEGSFYKKRMTYYDEDGFTYWTMGEPVDVTEVINRCPKEDTYEERLKNGRLPVG